MLVMNERKKHTRKSAVKSFADGYIRSGDLYGKHGLENLKERRNQLAHNTLYSDKEQLSKDWISVGKELDKAMTILKEENFTDD